VTFLFKFIAQLGGFDLPFSVLGALLLLAALVSWITLPSFDGWSHLSHNTSHAQCACVQTLKRANRRARVRVCSDYYAFPALC
jgi:predicted MFS family arabinose efflux permease